MSLRCCKKPSKFLIIYDCGLQESKWKVCAKHFENDPRKFTLIVAADSNTHKYALDRGFFAIHPSKYNVTNRHTDKEWYETYGKPWGMSRHNVAKMGFPDSMSLLVTCIAELLDMGYTVISQDADVVWRNDVRKYLGTDALHNIHLATQMAPRFTRKLDFSFCGMFRRQNLRLCRVFCGAVWRYC